MLHQANINCSDGFCRIECGDVIEVFFLLDLSTCAAIADLVKVFESSYPMCSVCNQSKEKIVNCPMTCHEYHFILSFLQSKYICTPSKTSIAFNFKVMINDKIPPARIFSFENRRARN